MARVGKRFESSTFLFERLLDEKEQQMAVLESVFAIERKELTKERPIASGGFGEVYVQKKEFSSLALLLGSFFFITCT